MNRDIIRPVIAYAITTWGLALLLLVASGCGGSGSPSPQVIGESGQVHGLVVDVQGLPFGVPDVLTIRDDEGRVWEFTAEGSVAFTTSHLDQHRTLRLPVTISYRVTPDGLVAESIAD